MNEQRGKTMSDELRDALMLDLRCWPFPSAERAREFLASDAPEQNKQMFLAILDDDTRDKLASGGGDGQQ